MKSFNMTTMIEKQTEKKTHIWSEHLISWFSWHGGGEFIGIFPRIAVIPVTARTGFVKAAFSIQKIIKNQPSQVGNPIRQIRFTIHN